LRFSKLYLGGSIEDLTFDSIEQFILKEEPESQTLEYKSDGSRLSEYGEVISAFLNTGGGLVIIGAPREVQKDLGDGRKAKVCRGTFNPLVALSKDDAQRSLLSKVSPIPDAVRVQPILCEGGCVLIVDVERSSYPPHQFDSAYFIRLDGETKMAPHALVESLFLQRRGPNLECQVIPIRRPSILHEVEPETWAIDLTVRVLNNSRNIAEYLAFDLKADAAATNLSDGIWIEDRQPGDTLIPLVRDRERRPLWRYRLSGFVLHAYEWKSFESRLRVSWPPLEHKVCSIKIVLQAKDMLRRVYEYNLDLIAQPGEPLTPSRREP
jgi:hypothetical protein